MSQPYCKTFVKFKHSQSNFFVEKQDDIRYTKHIFESEYAISAAYQLPRKQKYTVRHIQHRKIIPKNT